MALSITQRQVFRTAFNAIHNPPTATDPVKASKYNQVEKNKMVKELTPFIIYLYKKYMDAKITESAGDFVTLVFENINIPISIGDTLLGGKFKNKRIVVKSISKNEKGDITINGKPLLKFRLIDEMFQNPTYKDANPKPASPTIFRSPVDIENELEEAQAVSGGKVHKFITGKNLGFKGKKYSEIHFETLGIDNKNGTIRLKIIAPKEIFGNEMNLDFRTVRRGSFFKTDTAAKFELSEGLYKPANIKAYYEALCKSEGITPLPVKFGNVGKGGAVLTFNPKTMKPLYISFDVNRMSDPEYAVIHELTHQIKLETEQNAYLGKQDQSPKFRKLQNRLIEKYMYSKFSDIFLKEDLRKWFGKGKTGSSGGGGWDRYGSDGQKLGKCGDGDDGDAYAACLSKEKAAKLGPKGRAAFVRRKRADQKKAGDAKKGGEQKKGQKPTFSKTGASEGIQETIKKVDGKYVVYPKKGGDRLGTHDTYKDALKQLQAIEASKARLESTTPSDVIKDLDKVKNDLLKKVDALIVKKKKLYSNVDIESPMSVEEKKLDKDIAELFSQINKLVLQKRKIMKESVINEKQLKGLDGISPNQTLDKISKVQKLKIIKEPGNIIDFIVPDWAKSKYKVWQVIGTGKIKKNISGDFFLEGKGPIKSSPAFKTMDDLIDGVDWKSMEQTRRFNEGSNNSKFIDEIYYDSSGNPCKYPTTLDGRCLDKYHPSSTMREPLSEMPMGDLQKIDQFADKQLNPIDVVLTDKHFFDRLNDPRNDKEISQAELIGFFKRLGKNKKQFLDFLDKYKEVVAVDDRTNINIPFMKQTNKAIAKTIMRKKDFKSSTPKLDI